HTFMFFTHISPHFPRIYPPFHFSSASWPLPPLLRMSTSSSALERYTFLTRLSVALSLSPRFLLSIFRSLPSFPSIYLTFFLPIPFRLVPRPPLPLSLRIYPHFSRIHPSFSRIHRPITHIFHPTLMCGPDGLILYPPPSRDAALNSSLLPCLRMCSSPSSFLCTFHSLHDPRSRHALFLHFPRFFPSPRSSLSPRSPFFPSSVPSSVPSPSC
ncbi:hypothetical protein DFH06DRAFT_1168901, partial [Mycena polygramma]